MKKCVSDESPPLATSSTALATPIPAGGLCALRHYESIARLRTLFWEGIMISPVNTPPRPALFRQDDNDRTIRARHAGCASAAVLLLLAGLALVAGCSNSAKGGGPPQYPPPEVTTTTVEQKDVPVFGEWVANLDGYTNAQIQPQVTGYLIRQDYKEGSQVRTGQVLYEIDPRPFQATLDQAKGQLAQAKAQLLLAQINTKRDTPLAEARAIARSQLDNDLQTQAADEATVQAQQAAVESAQLNLGWTKVRSLLDGIAGIATTQVGSLVTQSTVLTTVSQVQPIKVYFAISEQEYLALSNKVRSAGGSDLLHSADRVPIQLTLSNGSVYPGKGRIIFVDRQINSNTGTIRVAAAFPNPQSLLRPGQYGSVRAQTELQHGALVVPQRAVTELQGSYQVAIITNENKVHIQPVQVGPQIGTNWIITSGLKPGESVVIEGTGKLVDGIPVHPHPAAPEQAKADQPSPDQANSDQGGSGNKAKTSASSSEGK
ncbi:MAG: rane fusion protein multidrug efflux system [Acidobacteriaceae bacterium]|nr:rane fusion protein multidrug efflux system [Acidobacteriaceae bacterium]